jgi:thiol-disulfide isomerase/thioredoxin
VNSGPPARRFAGGPVIIEGVNPPGPARKHAVYLWAAAALLTVAVAAVIVAARAEPPGLAGDPGKLPIGPSAPELHAKGWVNSAPLGAKELAGKVVVYDFWTYSCVNCVRTLPYLRSWYDRYGKDGLVVVGVHSPEFEFEKDHTNVEGAVARLAVTWPVALDDDKRIWNDFENRYWPAKFVTDRQGHLRYFHPGEGAYQETEDVLRALLGVASQAPRAAAPDSAAGARGVPKIKESAEGREVTPETYLGTLRGDVAVRGRHDYPEGAAPGTDQVRLVGTWDADGERVRSAAPGASIVLAYQAREVNLVMAAAGSPLDVVVELDGQPLPPEFRTTQTHVDGAGRTVVRVSVSDLYRLALGPKSGHHTLRLTAAAAGLDAFAFTFGA